MKQPAPLQQHLRACEKARPVLLLHGIFDTSACFGAMARFLAERGWAPHALDLRPNDGRMGLDGLAQQVAAYASAHLSTAAPFDLIGFSMGGLVGRYYVQRLGGLRRVRRFVTLATPHRGSLLAYLLGTPASVQMRPGSAFLRDLDRDAALLERVTFTSVWTPWDLMVLPGSSGRPLVGRAIKLSVPLHPWMLTSPRSLALVAQLLEGDSVDEAAGILPDPADGVVRGPHVRRAAG